MRPLAIALILTSPIPPQDPAAPDFTLTDVSGKAHSLRTLAGKKAVAILFMGIECPRSRAAEARVAALAAKFADRGAAFLVVNSNRHESVSAIADHARQVGFPLPVLKDHANKVADLYGVTVQPTAVLLDGAFRVRYRGLIDDDKLEEFVRTPYLRKALEALLAGRDVETKVTEPEGCTIKREAPAKPGEGPTYAKDVAPLLNRACVSCHRPGQIGPFSLLGYERASAWAPEIKRYVKNRRMPPWKPVSVDFEYTNDRRLSAAEIDLLARWADAGAPLGDAGALPPDPLFRDGWELGPPDLVLEPEADFELEAKGPDVYRAFVFPTRLAEPRYVTAVEFKPGNPKIVHHIMTYIDTFGMGRARDRRDPGPGFNSSGTGPGFFPAGDLGGWGPGTLPAPLPPGTGRLLPKGSDIVMEVHYHKSGRPEKDRTRLGLYFAKEPVRKRVRSAIILDLKFEIPADAERHPVTSSWVAPHDIHVLAVIPHMHLIGREIQVTAKFPDGSKRTLVRIDDWDFTWQETYFFKDPPGLPKGTRVEVTSWFDNSARNPRNPNRPPRAVRFGENTTDEMSVAYLAYTRDAEDLSSADK
jgi:peroxiredoxin